MRNAVQAKKGFPKFGKDWEFLMKLNFPASVAIIPAFLARFSACFEPP